MSFYTIIGHFPKWITRYWGSLQGFVKPTPTCYIIFMCFIFTLLCYGCLTRYCRILDIVETSDGIEPLSFGSQSERPSNWAIRAYICVINKCTWWFSDVRLFGRDLNFRPLNENSTLYLLVPLNNGTSKSSLYGLYWLSLYGKTRTQKSIQLNFVPESRNKRDIIRIQNKHTKKEKI